MSGAGKEKSSKTVDRSFQSNFRVQKILEDAEKSRSENFAPTKEKLREVLNSLEVRPKIQNCDNWKNLIKIVANQECCR